MDNLRDISQANSQIKAIINQVVTTVFVMTMGPSSNTGLIRMSCVSKILLFNKQVHVDHADEYT